MKSDIEIIYGDRCAQLARQVAAAMTLSQALPVEAVEMTLTGAREWFAARPDSGTDTGRLMLAGIAIALATVDQRLLRRSEESLVKAVEAALSELRTKRPRRARRARRR